MRTLLALILLSAPMAAQKDFLTSDEVAQLREIQDPNLRLQLYLRFAQQRIDLLDQLFAKQKTGRSGMIHDTLEQYTEIIDAIDTNIDNAIRKRQPLTSMTAVAKAERELQARLEKHLAVDAPDKGRYQFALEQAVETTKDSAEISEQDLTTRTREVEAHEAELKKERDELLTPQRKDELQADSAKVEAEKQGTSGGKKRPSLLKPGEKPGQTNAPADKPKDPAKK